MDMHFTTGLKSLLDENCSYFISRGAATIISEEWDMSLGNVFQYMLALNGFKLDKTMQNLGKINIQDDLDSQRESFE